PLAPDSARIAGALAPAVLICAISETFASLTRVFGGICPPGSKAAFAERITIHCPGARWRLRSTKLPPPAGVNVTPAARRIVSPAVAVSRARCKSAADDTDTRRPGFAGTAVHNVATRYGSSEAVLLEVAATMGRTGWRPPSETKPTTSNARGSLTRR